MTTLELAEKIIDAVLEADANGADDGIMAAAIFSVLHENNAWFCRVGEDERGITVETPFEQPSLF